MKGDGHRWRKVGVHVREHRFDKFVGHVVFNPATQLWGAFFDGCWLGNFSFEESAKAHVWKVASNL